MAPTNFNMQAGRWLLMHAVVSYAHKLEIAPRHVALLYTQDSVEHLEHRPGWFTAHNVWLVLCRTDSRLNQVQKPNGNTGPTTLAFPTTMEAMAYATAWLKRRGENARKTAARRAAFVENKKAQKRLPLKWNK